jgi:ribosomal protein S18 acetylase RimI-like enzyme
MPDEIILRPAKLNDAQRLAELWVAAFPDKFGPILGEKAELVLCDWLRLSQRHLQTTTLAEVNGCIVGFIVLETPLAPNLDDGRWLWHALQLHHGILGALRGLLLMLLVNTNHRPGAEELYIEMLGVDQTWRGLGIASHLMCHAETIARQQKLAHLALAVVSDNCPAIELYEKLGFKITLQRQSRLLKWITGHPGYYEMVKELEE